MQLTDRPLGRVPELPYEQATKGRGLSFPALLQNTEQDRNIGIYVPAHVSCNISVMLFTDNQFLLFSVDSNIT